jgi:hypothetical protein
MCKPHNPERHARPDRAPHNQQLTAFNYPITIFTGMTVKELNFALALAL